MGDYISRGFDLNLKIWIVNHYAKNENRHYFLAKHLIQHGHDVAIIASSFDHEIRKELHLQKGHSVGYEIIGGVPFVWIKTHPYSGNNINRAWNMVEFSLKLLKPRLITHFVEPPNVVVGSSPHLFGAMGAHRLSRRFKVPFVLEIRDLWPESLVDLGSISRKHPAVRALAAMESYLYRNAQAIFVLMPGAIEYIDKFTNREKIHWLPNGVEPGIVPKATPKQEKDIFRVMYAGAHGLANGLDTVIDTAKLIQQRGLGDKIQITLIGDGPEKLRLVQRVDSESINCVQFLDLVTRHEVYKIMQTADAFIMVLLDSPVFRWGVSPNKLFDYMISTRPVLFAVNSPYNPVKSANAGLTVPAENPEALADAIIKLSMLSSEELWNMGLRGRRYVEGHHDYAILAKQLEDVLAEAVISYKG